MTEFSNLSITYTYVTTHSQTLPSLYLHHSSFSNPSVASPTLQLILQPFHCFIYITAHSPTLLLLYLCHSSFSNPSVAWTTSQSFSNPSFASPMSQALHLCHLASCPWYNMSEGQKNIVLPSEVAPWLTHETRIWEVPGSNPGANQPDWGFIVVFLNHQGKCQVN